MNTVLLSAGLLATQVSITGFSPPSTPLGVLADRADVVAVGTIEGIRGCGQQTPSGDAPTRVRLTILRVLKGGIGVGAVIGVTNDPPLSAFPERYYWEYEPDGTGGLSLHSRTICSGIWFLQRTGDDDWRVMPAGHGDDQIPLPAVELPTEWRYAPGEALIDKLVYELRTGFESEEDVVVSESAHVIKSLRSSLQPPLRVGESQTAEAEGDGFARFRRHLEKHGESCITARTLKD